MAQKDATSRRNVLRTVVGSSLAGVSIVGSGSTQAGSTESREPSGASLPDAVYVDGLGEPSLTTLGSTEVQKPIDAELAILGTDHDTTRTETIEAINGGTPVSFVGRGARRSLIGDLQNRSPDDVDDVSGLETTVSDDVDYSFGYVLPSQPQQEVALARPNDDVGVLELHTKSIESVDSSTGIRESVSTYSRSRQRGERQAQESQAELELLSSNDDPRSARGDEWTLQSVLSQAGTHCPGGEVLNLTRFYTVSGTDTLASWDFEVHMTPSGAGDECTPVWARHNHKVNQQFDFDGDLRSWGPSSTTSSRRAEVGITATEDGVEAGASWSYEVPDVTIDAIEHITDDAIEWNHELDLQGSMADTTFKTKPAAVVAYDEADSMATYSIDSMYEFKTPSYLDLYTQVHNEGDGVWPL